MTYLTLRKPTGNLFSFYSPLFVPHCTRTGTDGYNWIPSVDISETDAGFEVRAELPGIAKDDVHVSVKDNLLTLSGEKRQEKVDDTQNRRSGEGRYGSFHRRFTLPREVKIDDIRAELGDGVLKLFIPKPEAVKPIEIPITPAS